MYIFLRERLKLTDTTIRVQKELVSALKTFKEAYGFHSLNEAIWQLLHNAKVKAIKK